MKYFLLVLFNQIYKRAYIFYEPVYFLYKNVSEKDHVKLFKDHIKSGMTVVDVGANIGFYTILFSELVGKNGKVYAFEPDPENFKHLKNNLKDFKNVILFENAVAERRKSIKLYHSDNLNVDHQTFDIGEGRRYKTVQAIDLDSVFNKQKIDVIKIDIQGYDYFALLGMKKLLKRSKKILVVGELWPFGLVQAGAGPRKCIDMLEKMNFKVSYFQNVCEFGNLDKSYYCDFFAMKNEK